MNYIYRGSRVNFMGNVSSLQEISEEEFILVEMHDHEFVFQIVCIKGYNAGCVYGYIKKDEMCVNNNIIGVTKKHLLSEFERFFRFNKETFKVISK